MSTARQIEERAAYWLARKEAREWSAADQSELEAWLAQSTTHQVAYLRLEYGWGKANRLAALRTPSAVIRQPEPPTATRIAKREPPLSRRPLQVGVAAVLLLSVGALFAYRVAIADRYATEIGGHEIVRLEDGTRIELNTNTLVRTDLNEAAREVWLDRGEAYFDVARDTTKPFVVNAGPRRVTVLGTKFSIRRDGEQVQLAVTEGRVKVETQQYKPTDAAIIATPGDTVTARGETTVVKPKPVREIDKDLSWRHGTLIFDRTTLAAAAEEFNRYNRTRLVVEDPDLATMKIGGSFEAANVEAFARILEHSFGLATAEEAGQIRVSR